MKNLYNENEVFLEYLQKTRKYFTQKQLAETLGVNIRTVRRWESLETIPPNFIIHSLKQLLPPELPFSEDKSSKFKFIDLFAGIGGIRIAFESIGGECVFTSEWDSYSQKTYRTNFNDSHEISGDITKIDEKDIPDHDILLAGFPCQPFSIAGVSKKNSLGRNHGFDDETQGTLFFDIVRILKEKKPKAFLLENVKNLTSHDKGRTFEVIKRTLTEKLGYRITYRVIDAAHFLPQHRERIFIIGFLDKNDFDINKLTLPEKNLIKIDSVLHKKNGNEPYLKWDEEKYFNHKLKKIHEKYVLSDKLWSYLQNYAKKHQEKGNGFGFGLVTKSSVSRTLSARYYKDGSEILVKQNKINPRRLTPRECARLMGFPDNFKIPVSDTRAYKQFGNSVAVPVVKFIAENLKYYLTNKN